jgi:hypothetical protein
VGFQWPPPTSQRRRPDHPSCGRKAANRAYRRRLRRILQLGHDYNLAQEEALLTDKPFADANRARTVAIDFIDKLTNAELVEKAEQMERQGSAALAAVR